MTVPLLFQLLRVLLLAPLVLSPALILPAAPNPRGWIRLDAVVQEVPFPDAGGVLRNRGPGTALCALDDDWYSADPTRRFRRWLRLPPGRHAVLPPAAAKRVLRCVAYSDDAGLPRAATVEVSSD